MMSVADSDATNRKLSYSIFISAGVKGVINVFGNYRFL